MIIGTVDGNFGGSGLQPLIWSTPILWSAWDAPAAAAFFRDALGALPDWYIAGYLAISGAVWGISELKAAGVWKR